MKNLLCVLLLFFAASGFAAEESGLIERYLIAVGANDGGNDRPKLRYAAQDAKSFMSVLSEMGGVSKQNEIFLEDPSVKEIDAAMTTMEKHFAAAPKIKGRREILFFYSGHADERGLLLGKEVFPWKDLRKQISNLSADVKISVIDACGSGAITRLKGGVSVPAFLMDESSDMKGYAFITSSTQDEASQESDRIKGSFFTHAFVSGLRGGGDLTGDGKVTLSEAYQFAFNETLHRTQQTMGGAQHPSRDMNLAGTGDVVMTDVRRTSATLALDSAFDGRFFIRDESNLLVAELYKKSGREVEIGLPAGEYKVQLDVPSKNYAAAVRIKEGNKTYLNFKQMKEVAAERTVSRGSAVAELDSSKAVKKRFSFNFFDFESEPRKGVQLGFFAAKARENMSGVQVSLFANVAQKEFRGTQVSVGLNYAKYIRGAQFSMLNIAESIDGAQVSPTVNIATNSSQGFQLSVSNFAGDTLEGVQVGVMNIGAQVNQGQFGVFNAAGNVGTAQAGVANFTKTVPIQAGIFNAAKEVNYVQAGVANFTKTTDTQVGVFNAAGNVGVTQAGVGNFSGKTGYSQAGVFNVTGKTKAQGGVINIAGTEDLFQLGVMNIAGNAGGRQIGIINICGTCDKTPVGIISIVGNGVWAASAMMDETANLIGNLRLGTEYFYTVLEYTRGFEDKKMFREFGKDVQYGFGFGTQFGRKGTHVNMEYVFLNVYSKHPGDGFSVVDIGSDSESNYHHRVRLGTTVRLFPWVGIRGGISASVVTEGYADRFNIEPKGEWHAEWNIAGREVRVWPGLYAGLIFGKF
ncbi:MAG: caspase family protein [Fibrobacter sp.]|jgi:hypothetical protein|nr:caspase family protein [Fibrobacter sp.]